MFITELQRPRSARTPRAVANVSVDMPATKLSALLNWLLQVFAYDEGQGMVEYALILVLIAVVVIVVLIILGNQIQNVFCNISGGLAT
jgi:pilus assembly protein Flp/PilA